ncbi:MAG: asparagine synthase (glutamine-hydrolyzing) [Eubacterium sp.]|nr:asparagine synthase (glutamine-hydrolyzing) [Eubacterium sp.]
MCGFVGFTNSITENKRFNETIIKSMSEKIVHRGPEHDGYYVDRFVSLGFRDLSISEVGSNGQPIISYDGSKILVYDGEIYNHMDLRKELEKLGYKFNTLSDSETILVGYQAWGRAVLKKLRGMFAFVIWDSKEEKFFGARDIFGIKPFYYYLKSKTFLFGSEIKAFLGHPQFEKKLNIRKLPDYLCFEYIPTNETFFKDVYKLSPGTYFEYQDGKMTLNTYFESEYNIDTSHNEDYWAEEIDQIFKDSAKIHAMTSDYEVGCLLSSGVDSSYVVHEMNKHIDVQTFSIGFVENEYSEISDAKKFADGEKVINYSKDVSADEFFEITPDIMYYMDEPLPNPSAIPLYFLTKLASEKVKVVLSGEGADELFGGYNYYHEPLDFKNYMKLPQFMRDASAFVVDKMPDFHGKRFLMRGKYPIEERFIRHNYVFNRSEVCNVLSETIPSKDPSYYTKPFFDKCTGLDDISKMQYVDIRTWLPQDILVMNDRMSMANSLELRVPFLDREMLSIAMKIPVEYRVSHNTTKYILRKAAEKNISTETAFMAKKGFVTPLNDWLRQDKYYSIVRDKFTGDVAKKFFNVDYLLEMLMSHREGTAKNMKKIWMIYVFILWYEKYFIEN